MAYKGIRAVGGLDAGHLFPTAIPSVESGARLEALGLEWAEPGRTGAGLQ